MVSTVAIQVDKRLAKDEDANASGIVVNTCGWVEGPGLDVVLHVIKAFSIDIILVMNHDKLYSNLVASVDGVGSKTVVVKLPISGGIVRRVSLLSLYVLCWHMTLGTDSIRIVKYT